MGNVVESSIGKTRKAKVIVECPGHRVIRGYSNNASEVVYYFDEERPNALDDSLSFVTVGVLTAGGNEVPDGATLVMPSGIVIEMLRLIDKGDGKHKPELIQ